jgi:hypothetical protein
MHRIGAVIQARTAAHAIASGRGASLALKLSTRQAA